MKTRLLFLLLFPTSAFSQQDSLLKSCSDNFKAYICENFLLKRDNESYIWSNYNERWQFKIHDYYNSNAFVSSPYVSYVIAIDRSGSLHFNADDQPVSVKWDYFEEQMKPIIEAAPKWKLNENQELSYVFTINMDSLLFNRGKTNSAYGHYFTNEAIFYNPFLYGYIVQRPFLDFAKKPDNLHGDTLAKFIYLPNRVCDTTQEAIAFLQATIEDTSYDHHLLFKETNIQPKADNVFIDKNYTANRTTSVWKEGCPYYSVHYNARHQLSAIGNLDENGRKTGYWIYFTNNGKLRTMEGLYEDYEVKIVSGGKTFEEKQFGKAKVKGKRRGLWKYYHPEGYIYNEEYYNEKGKLEKDTHYSKEEKTVTERYFDKSGKIIRTSSKAMN